MIRREGYSKNAGVFEGVLKNGFLDRREDEANVRGISGLREAALHVNISSLCIV